MSPSQECADLARTPLRHALRTPPPLSGEELAGASACNFDDGDECRFHVLQDELSRDAKRFDATSSEPCIPPFIALRSFSKIVAAAVDFDNQASRMTIKVRNIDTRRMLPSKFQIGWSLSQLLPQQDFR